jgi:hypothetical protein
MEQMLRVWFCYQRPSILAVATGSKKEVALRL